MDPARLAFLLRHDLTVIRRVKWRVAEITYFPLTTIVIWGFFARAAGPAAAGAALAVLAVNVLWNFAAVAQSTTNLQIVEDIWSGSLRQVLLTGVTPAEYVSARIAFAMLLSVPIGGALVAIALPFGLSVHGMYAAVAWAGLATAIASAGLALLVAAGVFLLGREYAFLAWTVIQLFVLFSAPMNDPAQFPAVLELVSRAMPFTDAFSIARAAAAGPAVPAGAAARALAVGAVYVAASYPLYLLSFRHARRTGMLAKL